jgi:adenylate cyclase
MDFAAAGLLDGLEGEERAARIRLLESLEAAGFAVDELKAAVAEDRLALLPVERVLAGRYTARELEEQTGVPVAVMLRIRRSLGLPEGTADEKLFSDEDIAAARSIQEYLDAGFSEDAMVEITRVLGEGMARLSAASGFVFAETFLRAGDSEDEVAWRFADLADNLTPLFEPILGAAFRAHQWANVRRNVLSRDELASGQVIPEQELTVCFADLVGFTRLGSELDTGLLGDVVGTFSQLAAEVADAPVRLIKTIGDAALLVSTQPGPLVDAALTLVDQVDAEDLPAVRAGIAWGPAIPRSGDLYGHAVNLASRVTGIARPSSVLCTKEVHDAAEEFEWSFAGNHRLKGIADSVPLYRARRPAVAEAGSDEATSSNADDELRRRTAGRRRR